MKVITIKQPWATLIAKGYKKYEFRSWNTKYRGEILIHAGASVDKKAMDRFKHLNLEYDFSVIVAKVIITDVIKLDDISNKRISDEDEIIYGKSSRDGYAWVLTEVQPIESKTMVKGKLSIWNLDKY